MKKYSLEWFRKYHQRLRAPITGSCACGNSHGSGVIDCRPAPEIIIIGGGPKREFKDSVCLGCGGYTPYEMYWRNKIADEIEAAYFADICSDPECCHPGDSSCYAGCSHEADAEIARGDQ